jgi:ribonuclease R
VDFGPTATAANEIPVLLFDHARSTAFSEAVLAESRNPALAEEADRARRDLRGRLVFTLDPADAHDFDDAISLDGAGEGRVRLGIHIADVAAYVLPGSAVDREARERGCTAYLVDRVERMLPEELTVKTCSLQPGEDHRAHTVDLVLDEATGEMLSCETFRSVIRSSARLDYEGVQEFLEGRRDGNTFPAGIAPVLRRLAKLATILRKARFAAGALDFALPEIHCILGKDGEPQGFEKRGASEAYNLVEECMLLANKAVAEKLFAAKVPFLSRIHDAPDEEQWEAMGAQLAAMGLPVVRNPREINRLMRQLRGDPREYMAQLAVLRNLNRAVYSEESRPHFGLAFRRYAHFTSPIRRYPDLIVHRMLCALEDGQKPVVSRAGLAAVAAECSEAERAAAELEQESVRLKRIRYYANLWRNGERGPWEGIVTGFSPKGIFVELADTFQTGLLPFSALADGFYEVAPNGLSASAGKKHSYRLGQRVWVAIGEVDERLGRIDWTVPEAPRKPSQKKSSKKRK